MRAPALRRRFPPHRCSPAPGGVRRGAQQQGHSVPDQGVPAAEAEGGGLDLGPPLRATCRHSYCTQPLLYPPAVRSTACGKGGREAVDHPCLQPETRAHPRVSRASCDRRRLGQEYAIKWAGERHQAARGGRSTGGTVLPILQRSPTAAPPALGLTMEAGRSAAHDALRRRTWPASEGPAALSATAVAFPAAAGSVLAGFWALFSVASPFPTFFSPANSFWILLGRGAGCVSCSTWLAPSPARSGAFGECGAYQAIAWCKISNAIGSKHEMQTMVAADRK